MVVNIENVKKNWPVYRCNPMVMPFAGYFGHEPVKNFVFCVQNMQTNFMQYLLEPVHFSISIIHRILASVLNSIQFIREKIASFIQNIKDVINSIFSVFINIIIQFQKIIIKLKDTFAKVIGIMTTTIYLVSGAVMSGTSIVNGPIGTTLCFHPDTPVQMLDGSFKKMSTIEPGEYLSNNSRVLASLDVLGNTEQTETIGDNNYYSIYDSKLGRNIYVTGEHKIYDSTKNKFVPVRDHINSKIVMELKTNRMACLVTHDHMIPVGEHIFWDWED